MEYRAIQPLQIHGVNGVPRNRRPRLFWIFSRKCSQGTTRARSSPGACGRYYGSTLEEAKVRIAVRVRRARKHRCWKNSRKNFNYYIRFRSDITAAAFMPHQSGHASARSCHSAAEETSKSDPALKWEMVETTARATH
ncbi:uncharacterized protein [Temnothorax nylanderi]|uniref:uncharacterized protein n=1 Tax=Temnothorax nylanderi TaxID=102681 RepID=UPI003A85E564